MNVMLYAGPLDGAEESFAEGTQAYLSVYGAYVLSLEWSAWFKRPVFLWQFHRGLPPLMKEAA